MSDDERVNIPQATVDQEFERAEQMLADATKAHEVGISKATIVNRLYYACFHAAQAALYARGFNHPVARSCANTSRPRVDSNRRGSS